MVRGAAAEARVWLRRRSRSALSGPSTPMTCPAWLVREDGPTSRPSAKGRTSPTSTVACGPLYLAAGRPFLAVPGRAGLAPDARLRGSGRRTTAAATSTAHHPHDPYGGAYGAQCRSDPPGKPLLGADHIVSCALGYGSSAIWEPHLRLVDPTTRLLDEGRREPEPLGDNGLEHGPERGKVARPTRLDQDTERPSDGEPTVQGDSSPRPPVDQQEVGPDRLREQDRDCLAGKSSFAPSTRGGAPVASVGRRRCGWP